MNVVHEVNQLDFGGVERVVRNIVKHDRKNKHIIVTYRDGDYRKALEEAGATIIVAPKGTEPEMSIEADVIHIHTGGAESEIAKGLGKNFPIVETIHSPTRSAVRAEYVKQRVGVTNAVAEMNRPAITIYNGIDFDEIVPTKTPSEIKKELGIPEGIPVVGRLGRLGKDKYIEEWLLTCAELQRKGVNFVPLIVGGEAYGCEGYRGKLKLMCASLPVYNVVWAGQKADVANYFQIMDTFLYPSATEGFGLVFIEAMANDCVVVTYDTPVTREVLGGYAILTDKSIAGLVAGLNKSFDQNIRDAYQGIQYAYIRDEFNAERMSAEYQDLYDKVFSEVVSNV